MATKKLARTRAKKTETAQYTILAPDWNKTPSGTIVEGVHSGKTFKGRIIKEGGYVFVCSDTMIGGTSANNNMGYRSSGLLCRAASSPSDAMATAITRGFLITKVTLDPKFKIPEILKVGSHTVQFYKGAITVGCQRVSNATVEKIAKRLIK